MPELAPKAADAAELLNHLLESGDLTTLPDGRAVLSLVTDVAFLDRLAEWSGAIEDLEEEVDVVDDDAEDDDPIGEDADVEPDHRHELMLGADNVTWLHPPSYGRPHGRSAARR